MKYLSLLSGLLLFIFVNPSVSAQVVLYERVLDGNTPIELMSDGSWREVPKIGGGMVNDGNFVNIYANKTWYYTVFWQEFGNHKWDRSDLSVEHFTNGDTIREARNREAWFDALSKQEPAFIRSGFNEVLYNFHTIKDPRGVCLNDSRLPHEAVWDDLISHLGGPTTAGAKMKITYSNTWDVDLNNRKEYTEEELETSFQGNMVPPLYATPNSQPPIDFLFNVGETVYWSNTVDANGNAIAYKIQFNSDAVEKIYDADKASGYSIRCVKNTK